MKGRSLLVLPILVLAFGCGDDRHPTGLRAPTDASEIISDGVGCTTSYAQKDLCNPDFFFLPPMVPPPFNDPNFERGKFNPRLQASLKIEICELVSQLDNAPPIHDTQCAADPINPIKIFEPGSVSLVGVPSQQSGWWSKFDVSTDGFYHALWDTRQSYLSLDKYYRIKVLIDVPDEESGVIPDVLLGYADVDPVSNMREWRHTNTGEVVTLIDDSKLPIAFRVETGALCGDASQCGSAILTNDNPDGDSQILKVLNEEGVPVAGVLVPDGWLPEDGPQSVVFTIARVHTGVNNVAAGTQQFPCHGNLPLQQFDGCFNFSTIPELEPDEETGAQFAIPIIGAVCFVLHDTEDPREPWVQLWSSEPDEGGDQPIPLVSADASAILTDHDGQNCGTQEVIITDNSSNALTRLASAGWRTLTKGVGPAFGVKTAYAVDIGLGGILDGISNIGPALTAEIRAVTNDEVTVTPGSSTTLTARIVGTKAHNGDPLGDVTTESNTRPIPGLPVTYTVGSGHGTLSPIVTEGEVEPVSQITVTTTSPIVDNSLSGGLASVIWNLPTTPGTYTITATGQARGGPLTFTATVPEAALADLTINSGTPVLTPSQVPTTGGSVVLSSWTVTNIGATFSLEGTFHNGIFLSTDPTITAEDIRLTNNSNFALAADESFQWGGPTVLIPALSVGTYYIGILTDFANVVAESNEGNNYVSAPLTVVAAPSANSIQLLPTERRMVSMQGSATLYPTVAPPNTLADLTTDGPVGVGLDGSRLVILADDGGEDISGGVGTTINSVLGNEQPGPTLFVNSFAFNTIPRTTTLVWSAVSGATSYEVIVERGRLATGGECLPADCTVWDVLNQSPNYQPVTSNLVHTFDVPVSNAIRWRVVARNATGSLVSESPYMYFKYQNSID